MQKIEINTTQNVSIEFEAATLRERMVAFFIDGLIMAGVVVVISIVTTGFMQVAQYIYLLIAIPFFLFYTLTFEIFNDGQTPGKKANDLKVVKLNGSEPRSSDYVLRWAFRMIDIYFSLGALASIFISSSNNSQRLGDMAAETTVIKIKPTRSLCFSDIIKISSIDDYEPRYSEVKKLSEANMLLIKNVIDRYKKYPNPAHRESVRTLVSKIKEKIQVEQDGMTDLNFLSTLIKDYVVLTR